MSITVTQFHRIGANRENQRRKKRIELVERTDGFRLHYNNQQQNRGNTLNNPIRFGV